MKKKPTVKPARRTKTAAVRRLEQRLREAEETLDAIRCGDVDALVVQGPNGDQVFTLEGADHRYRQLVETMNEGALLIGAQRVIVYANARFANMVETPHMNVLGSTLDTYVASSMVPLLDALLRDRGAGAAKAEMELIAKNGTVVPVYLSATASWDKQEQLTCVIATDLSEQKRNQAMIADERLAARIVEQAAEGIVVCDLDGRITRASNAAQRVAGRNPLLLPFEEVFRLRGPEDPHAARTILQHALAGATTKGQELTLAHDDRAPVVLLLSAGPVLGPNRETVGCVVSFVDVTDSKRAAEERLRLLERTNQARLEAEAANRAKDEFLAMLGHELRNPLAPILTAIEVMKQRAEQGSLRERDVIERQVKHVVMLVDDLLDVSRIAQGKVELRKRPMALTDVVTKALEACSPILEDRDHHLAIDLAPGLVVDGDEARLCQVLSNLITNAAKYTPREGRIALVGTREGDEVVIVVRDNGMGIPPELLPNLFDLFVQGTRTLDRSDGGLGLGLSIVQSLVRLHGGTVAVRSDGIGKGSEFEVRLPALDAAALATPDVVAMRDKEPSATGRKVLIVDDNADAAELLADLLTAMGHETRVAFDGPSGLDAAAGFQPDIAFLDIGLPAMDGYELARRIRSEHDASHIRLVALTGYGQESDRQRSTAAGFDHHMVKPINLAAVASTIRRLT